MVGLKNIVLTLAYDGTNYKGFQNIKSLPSIENVLEESLYTILNEKVTLQAASRTDSGVHACCQIINFFSSTKLPLQAIHSKLNRLLPSDISILKINEAEFNFHPTLDCLSKEYHYFICNTKTQMPHHRLYSWHFPYALDFELMNKAALILTGKKNFEAFCNVRKNHTYESYIREIQSIEIIKLESSRIIFKIRGNKFLYKMVRNLVGTLLFVGCGKMSLGQLTRGLKSKNRERIGMTAKAHGLTLAKLYY